MTEPHAEPFEHLVQNSTELQDLLLEEDLGGRQLTLQMVEILDMAGLSALSLLLEREDAHVHVLELNLPSNANLVQLAELVTLLPRHPELQSLTFRVDGCETGPFPPAFRMALARSKVCLVKGGATLRNALFLELDQRERHLFSDMDVWAVADRLSRFRQMTPDDASKPLPLPFAQGLIRDARLLDDEPLRQAVLALCESACQCSDLDAVLNPAHWGSWLDIDLNNAQIPIGSEQARLLIGVLKRPGIRVEALRLNLDAGISPDLLHELLSLACSQSGLVALELRVNGSTLGTASNELRCAVAQVSGCLQFDSIRAALFKPLLRSLETQRPPQDHEQQAALAALRNFIHTEQPMQARDRHWPATARCLRTLATANKDDALLIAVAVASPGQHIELSDVCDAPTCERLGLPYQLCLQLVGDEAAHALCKWAGQQEGPMCRGIALERVANLSPDGWLAVLNALVRCAHSGSLQSVRLIIYRGDKLELPPDTLLSGAHVPFLVIELVGFEAGGAEVPHGAVQLIETLRPPYLSLKGHDMPLCRATLDAVGPQGRLRLQGLFLAPENMPLDNDQLSGFLNVLKHFQGPGFISVQLPNRAFLDLQSLAEALLRSARTNPLIRGIELKHGANEGVGQRPTRWVMPLQLSHWKHGAEECVSLHVLKHSDLGTYLVRVAEFDEADLRRLSNVSLVARRRGEVISLAHAMRDGTLSAQELRTLLGKPTGELDTDLADELRDWLEQTRGFGHFLPLLQQARVLP